MGGGEGGDREGEGTSSGVRICPWEGDKYTKGR